MFLPSNRSTPPSIFLKPISCIVFVASVTSFAGCGGGGGASAPVVVPTPDAIVQVACVGDSITAGAALSSPARDGYPAVLGRKLGSSYQVRNYGSGGTTVLNSGNKPYQKSDLFEQALQFKPEIVVIELGTNDRERTFSGFLKSSFKADYKSLISNFQKANPAVKVYTCLPTPSYPMADRLNLTLSNDIVPLIREVAEETQSEVIDLYTPLSDKPELFPDGVHPTMAGASLIAETVYKSVAPK